jgi:hypothetical protein
MKTNEAPTGCAFFPLHVKTQPTLRLCGLMLIAFLGFLEFFALTRPSKVTRLNGKQNEAEYYPAFGSTTTTRFLI